MDRLLIFQKDLCLYECMKSAATSEFVALRAESPAVEFDDFDRLVERYRPKVLRRLHCACLIGKAAGRMILEVPSQCWS